MCCSDGQTYDTSSNLCVDSSTSGTTTESFITESMVNKVLSKKSANSETTVAMDGGNSVKPSLSESFIYK
jgi:hypothetical protein